MATTKSRFKTLYANTSTACSDPCLFRLAPSTPTSSNDDDATDARPMSPTNSHVSSQGSSIEHGTPERGIPSGARGLVTGRQVPWRLWQPDSEADKCSIFVCQKKFAEWTLLKSQRHHCRSCGRVVCHACSTGTRVLLPPRGERGPAKAVRVCDACLQNNETYNFCPSPKAAMHAPSLVSPNASVKNGSPPTGGLEDDSKNGEKWKDAASIGKQVDAKSGKEEMFSKPAMMRSNSAPSLVKLAEDNASESNSTTGSAEGEEEAKPNTVPVQVPNKKSSARAAVTKDLLEGMGEVDERVRRVQHAFAASSYYHGLLQHEPDALRILILAEASAEPTPAPAAAAT
mmetsp:Transcript_34154/g.80547  ORF Transcript_34154/g.80547 Transcript_34154/m.80547 type:complete len:343 (+) Transcript_34154:185-1213(+)